MTPRIILLLGIALVAVSTSSIFARLLPAVPAVVIAFWRMASASGMLWGYSAVKPQGTISGENTRKTIVAGFFLGLHFACFFGALKFTSVANATVLATMSPVFTILIERFGLRRSWNKSIVLGLIIAIVGALTIQGGRFNLLEGSQLGNGLALLSALWMAIVLLVAEQIRQETATLVYSRLVYSIAGLTLFIFALVMKFPVLSFGVREFFWFGMLGLVPTVIGHTTLNYAVKYIRPTVVASVPLGEPIVASTLAWFLLGEQVATNVFIGGGLVLTGLYIITTRHTISDFQNDTL